MTDIEEKVDAQHHDQTSFDLDQEAKAHTTNKNTQFSPELTKALETCAIKPWSSTTIHYYVAVFCGLCCSYANGYDGSLMSAIEAMAFWQSHFNNIGTGGAMISLIFSIYNVGCFVAGPAAAYITDRWGRRAGMASGAVVIIIGSVILVTSQKIGQFVAGRFILGAGISLAQLAAPTYVLEISPPQWRGRATGIYNCGWYAGAIPAAAVTFGTNYIQSNLSWQLPVILQCLAAVIVIALVFFIPESPRFLMMKGREEEAHAMLTKYHGGGDPNNALVLLEMQEMRETLQSEGPELPWWDYRPLFATKGNRWRMLNAGMMAVFGQFSGNGLAYFITVVMSQIGVTSVTAQLGYNLMYSSLAAVGALAGAAMTDRQKRRTVLTFGTLLLSVTLAVFSGLSATISKHTERGEPVPDAIGKAAIAVYILFGVFCAYTYTPLQALGTVEHFSSPMRAKGLVITNVLSQTMGFINLFAGPIALQNIGYKYIIFFACWDLVEAACWWLFGVEAQGRSLEEMDWVYEQPNPVAASKKLN